MFHFASFYKFFVSVERKFITFGSASRISGGYF